MTETERIKNTEEQIDLAGLLLGVDLSCLPPEEAMKLKRSALHLYRLGHASGFKAGVDHATNAIAAVRKARRFPGGPPRLVGVQNIAALDERNSYQNIHGGVTKWRIRLT
jgi:hypothetical protein